MGMEYIGGHEERDGTEAKGNRMLNIKWNNELHKMALRMFRTKVHQRLGHPAREG